MIIVVPMAGKGSRLAQTGYGKPKPLINVCGKPILHWALKSIEKLDYTKIIFIGLREHEDQYEISEAIHQIIKKDFQLILLDQITEGQLCTVLTADNHIKVDEDLLVVSSDTLVRSDIHRHISELDPNVHGLISVAKMPGDQWSFARIDIEGRVQEVAEKDRISDFASTGIYYFARGNEFLSYADEIIKNQEKKRGEYYIIPVYQKMIEQGLVIRLSLAQEMWDLGTPEAINNFTQKFNFSNLTPD